MNTDSDSVVVDDGTSNQETNNTPSKNSKRSFNCLWLRKFSWLIFNKSEEKMHCRLCQKHNKKNKFGQEGRYHYYK